ncbi:CDP-diacylglycerol--serine O-phosphatidyltransferase [Yanghanlia caeni]|uniref:CDP-diacylglycerol--serine O-phosphatidyltransferase n=1 Tax=Yanghanlia caeni TaxID=3064283 RepID=A0ABU1D797_9BURK|nr:CDP-diacylglycerol--serine O-phosphatidyltransferase [Alcaligenaceae bacterium LG-2]NGR09645.1 CDP-diacylglycerol--serine O-phosphatidyltransferase [bacterium SGD-2]HZH57007.1 CDP-diacylglycerol--serine O-phosphatidyltransferase [Burkholderiaceae bacterium]
MPSTQSDEIKRRRGIYLLPNAFTTANLFAGFFAVVQAMNGRFEMAAIAIFLALVFDGMDGRVARLTNTQSAFGEQYDSLADMISFGMAPALVMYVWALQGLGRWGWLAAFIYVVGAALRLARFNTNIGVVDKRFFQGLPSPSAAALVAGFVWLAVDNKLSVSVDALPWIAFLLTIYAGLAMVSNAPFYSGKSFALGRSVPFWVMLVVVGGFVFVSADPPLVLFGLFVLYGLSGWVIMAWRWNRARHLTRMRSELPAAADAAGRNDVPAPPHTAGSNTTPSSFDRPERKE